MAFADLLLDPQQMLMASVAAALGYEIEVCFLTRLFGVPGNHLGQQSHGFRWPYGPVNRHKFLRKIIPMKARMNLQSYHLHTILFMQQATKRSVFSSRGSHITSPLPFPPSLNSRIFYKPYKLVNDRTLPPGRKPPPPPLLHDLARLTCFTIFFLKGGDGFTISRSIGEIEGTHDELLNQAQLAAATEEKKAHSFEIDPSQVENVKQRCLPNALNYPMLEEYDFRNDTINPDLEMELKPSRKES
ncbi:hypothetical protein L1987_86683 [Smallanthus sonchifolius]|uniref:Uncharacterized protein n=1 Tax=Smallanthus sonchifolius TaxID=185202 RepID=A0ACB8Y190_9ASTR|nr:hypothetical protein L1987_86683 [Smallanthus sonchifolius]